MTNLKFSLSSCSMDRISHSPLSMAGAHSAFFLHHVLKLTSKPTTSRSSFFSLSLSTKIWSEDLSAFSLGLGFDLGLERDGPRSMVVDVDTTEPSPEETETTTEDVESESESELKSAS